MTPRDKIYRLKYRVVGDQKWYEYGGLISDLVTAENQREAMCHAHTIITESRIATYLEMPDDAESA